MSEETVTNSHPDDSQRQQLTQEELVEHYKKIFQYKPVLADAMIKLAEAKFAAESHIRNNWKKKVSPLLLIRDYPDAIKAIAMAKVATKFAAESSGVKDYRNFILKACDKLDEASKQPGLPGYLVEYIQALHESTLKLIPDEEDGAVSKNEQIAADAVVKEAYLDIIEHLIDIDRTLQGFLRKFERAALRNEKASAKNACCTKWLSIIAIFISAAGIIANMGIQWFFACRAENNDKTGKLIEVVRKSHPWCDQQIGVEDAKNVSLAFHAVTQAMQKNIQNKHEISRLQAELKKTQDRLDKAQKKYNELTPASEQAQKQLQLEINSLKKQIASLQSEVTSLKKQIEELKKASAPKTVPASTPEAIK